MEGVAQLISVGVSVGEQSQDVVTWRRKLQLIFSAKGFS